MTRARHEGLLVLGSNVAPERNVPAALALLEARFELVAVSPRYRSAAVGGTGSYPDFVNLALRIRTDCPPRALREACRRVEEACGRRRTSDRYAPRTLDIDVALLDDIVMDTGGWSLPDPDLAVQPHCLVPCADVWGEAVHPLRGVTLTVLRDALSETARRTLRRVDET